MRKTFKLNTVPHEAEIGDTILLFAPEVLGDEFIEGYARLREVQQRASGDESVESVREVTQGLKEFLAGFMLPESRDTFAAMKLPTRVLVELAEWVAELYGGGAGGAGKGNEGRPTGRSGGSPQQRRTPGTR